MAKQANPLALRMSESEKVLLTKISKQVNCSRHRLMRVAVLALASELSAEKLVEA